MTTAPLDIKVVYSSTGRPARHAPRPTLKVTQPRGPLGLSVVIGSLSLAAAALLVWLACWKVDRELYMVLMLKTPAIELTDATTNLNLGIASPPAGVANDARKGGLPAINVSDIVPSGENAPAFVGRTAQTVIVATRYIWPALAVLTAAALALSGGLAWGHAIGRLARVLAVLLFLAAVAYVAWRAYAVFMEYGRNFPPSRARIGLTVLVVLAGLLGLSIGRGAATWSRYAAILLVVLGLASVAGVYLGRLCNAIPMEHAWLAKSTGFLVAFAVFAAYAAVLYPLAGRLRR